MIWTEINGKPPQLIMTILDRGSLNIQESSIRISPKAIVLNEGEIAFFFSKFAQPIRVTISERGNPGFYTTARNVTLRRPVPHDDILIRSIESHRLLAANVNPLDTATIIEDVTPEPASMSFMNWGPKIPWNHISNTMEDTTSKNPSPSKATHIKTKSTLLGAETTGVTALAKIWAATAMEKEMQEPLPTGRNTAVIPKQRRPQKGTKQKILVRSQNVTIPCSYSNRLTPATLLEDIGNSPWVTPGSLIKAIFTPRNRPMGPLNLETPLSLQGIRQGDTLIMLIRCTKIYDPHDVQHFVAYCTEDAMQHFLMILLETSTISALTECVIFYEDLLLDLTSRFQDCNLPHKPTLHLCYLSSLDVPPTIGPENPESTDDADDQKDGPMFTLADISLPAVNPPESQNEPHETGNTRGNRVMALSTSPSQALVQDPNGKTHALLFHPQDSVAENLERHSIDMYFYQEAASSRQISQEWRTGSPENHT